MMDGKSFVIYFGIFMIVLYAGSKILRFYGIDAYEYAPYIVFWIFLFISTFVLGKGGFEVGEDADLSSPHSPAPTPTLTTPPE